MINHYTEYFSDSVGPYSPGLLFQKLCCVNYKTMCVNSEALAILPQETGSLNLYDLSPSPRLPPQVSVLPPSEPFRCCVCLKKIWVSTEDRVVVKSNLGPMIPPFVFDKTIVSFFCYPLQYSSAHSRNKSNCSESDGTDCSSKPTVWGIGPKYIYIWDATTVKLIKTIHIKSPCIFIIYYYFLVLFGCLTDRDAWLISENGVTIFNRNDVLLLHY